MKTVIFACVHNAGRSQMAAAFFNKLADRATARALCAGTTPGDHVHPEVVAVMQEEEGIDLSGARPQKLTSARCRGAALITMGCGDGVSVRARGAPRRLAIEDPMGQPVERVRAIRDDIRARVEALVAQEGAR